MNRDSLATTVLAVGLVASVLGCGGGASGAASDAAPPAEGGPDAAEEAANDAAAPLDATGAGAEDGGIEAAASDDGGLACGDAQCEPSQICLTPAYGCVAEALIDAGVCPAGAVYWDASGTCVQNPLAPSCVSPTPGRQYDCAGGDGGADCSHAGVPIPKSCSRFCRDDCA
jgi:hypothetical protein